MSGVGYESHLVFLTTGFRKLGIFEDVHYPNATGLPFTFISGCQFILHLEEFNRGLLAS